MTESNKHMSIEVIKEASKLFSKNDLDLENCKFINPFKYLI